MPENLYRMALGEGRKAVTAAIFWLKVRARWKEISVHEHGGIPGQPINEIRRIIVSPPGRETTPISERIIGATPSGSRLLYVKIEKAGTRQTKVDGPRVD